MKKSRILIIVFVVSIIVISCKKDDGDFVQVSAFENALHEEVNEHRASKGLSALALQFIMVKEAKAHAEGWANGTIDETNANLDLNERWQTVENKLGVNNVSYESSVFSVIGSSATAEEVVQAWVADTSIVKILEEPQLTQSGPGTGTTSDGRTYIMYLFAKFMQN